jgi:pilus assembly protein CpaE
MLRGLVICPDAELAEKLDLALAETNRVAVVRELDRYPNGMELMRLVRAHAPQVIFLSTESVPKALDVVETVEREAQGIQIIGFHRGYDPTVLLDVMRAGLREFLALPFEQQPLYDALNRVEEQIQKRPPALGSSDFLFAFLPSKPGVGTSTVALNAAVAMSRHEENGVLMMDMDLTSGIIGFMLKMSSVHSVVDAAENAHILDEANWPQIVCRMGKMDVLPSGRLNPEFRIEGSQVRHILDFARRHYKAICVDLSGNLERYSLEIMHEAKRIFLVCTPEIPSLHLAREKLSFLANADLADRVSVLLNRSQKRSLITSEQIQSLLGVPVMMQFPNDYQGVHRALQLGKAVEVTSDLGKQFAVLANIMLERKAPPEVHQKGKSFVEYFSILPGKYSVGEKKPAV